MSADAACNCKCCRARRREEMATLVAQQKKRPFAGPIKEYALERQFNIKRRNGSFI